jgi:DNA-directed RNA polymerase sigma subunit (sigma70/sigma32)
VEDRTGRRVGPADVRPLSERERALLRLRYPDGGAPRTLAEVGRALGVSAPRAWRRCTTGP